VISVVIGAAISVAMGAIGVAIGVAIGDRCCDHMRERRPGGGGESPRYYVDYTALCGKKI